MKRKVPIGRSGSWSPARERRIALRDGADGLVLADDAVVQALLHVDELLDLGLHQAADRDAGPARHDLGDVLGVDDVLEELEARLRLVVARLELGEVRLELGDAPVLQLGGPAQVGLALRALELGAGLVELALDVGDAADGLLLALPLGASSRRAPRAARPGRTRSSPGARSEASSVSFFSASCSISSCMMRRRTSSISVGTESTSILSREAASSMRSIALSGRKRSAM